MRPHGIPLINNSTRYNPFLILEILLGSIIYLVGALPPLLLRLLSHMYKIGASIVLWVMINNERIFEKS